MCSKELISESLSIYGRGGFAGEVAMRRGSPHAISSIDLLGEAASLVRLAAWWCHLTVTSING
jgi:hypothetical protein